MPALGTGHPQGGAPTRTLDPDGKVGYDATVWTARPHADATVTALGGSHGDDREVET